MTKSEIAKSIAKTAKVFSIIGIIGSLIGGFFFYTSIVNMLHIHAGQDKLFFVLLAALVTAINITFIVLLKLLCYGFAEMLHNGATE